MEAAFLIMNAYITKSGCAVLAVCRQKTKVYDLLAGFQNDLILLRETLRCAYVICCLSHIHINPVGNDLNIIFPNSIWAYNKMEFTLCSWRMYYLPFHPQKISSAVKTSIKFF